MHDVTWTIWRKMRLRISQRIRTPFLLGRAPLTLAHAASRPTAIEHIHAVFSPSLPRAPVALDPLTLSCPVLFTQGKFLHFPGRRFGQSLDKFDALGGFEVGHVVPTERDEILLAGVLVRLEHHQGLWHLPPSGVWHTDNGCFKHCRMLVEQRFNFHRRNILTTTDDHVLGTIHHLNITIGVHHREIAAVEPAAAHRFCGFLRLFIIPFHDVVAACYDFTHGPAIPWHLVELLVYDAYVCKQLRDALPRLQAVTRRHIEIVPGRLPFTRGQKRASFGQAVEMDHLDTQRLHIA